MAYTGTVKTSYSTPKAKRFFKIAKDLRKTARKLNFKCENLREKVKNMEKVDYSPIFLKCGLNKTTYDFFNSQLKFQKLHPK